MQSYDIQNEIITQAKYWGILTISNILYGLVLFQIASAFRERVFVPIQNIGFCLFLLFGIFWVLPNPGNPKKSNFQRLLILIAKNRHTYHPLPIYEIEDESEEPFFLNEKEWQQAFGEEGALENKSQDQ